MRRARRTRVRRSTSMRGQAAKHHPVERERVRVCGGGGGGGGGIGKTPSRTINMVLLSREERVSCEIRRDEDGEAAAEALAGLKV